MTPLKICAILLCFIGTAFSANILFLNPVASPSHHLWNKVIIRGLAEKGHNITMVSVDNDENPPPNVHYIYLESVYKLIYGDQKDFLLDLAESGPFSAIQGFYGWCSLSCEGSFKSKGFDEILNYPDDFKFDLVIQDFGCGPCLLPLLHKFKYPPLVSVTAFGNPPYSHHLTGGHKFPAIVPYYSADLPHIMNYPQRLFNSFLYAVDSITCHFVTRPNVEKIARERFEFDFPSLTELEKKTKLMLVNTDNAVDFPEPLQPNVIQVGGLQIVEPKKLSEDLLKFIESGKRGTVLMSLGTNMKSNMLGNERLENILKTFDAIPDYNFIWKFESELSDLPIKPSKNVFISKFLPQNDILAHQHVKAFVTHVGLLSSQESMWYGKPMIGIPFFVDQKMNVKKLKKLGIAVEFDFRTLNVDNFKNAILTVLEDPSYEKNSRKISKLFQDKPQKPLETALWWIEYVMRNPNAPQFSPTSLKIGWFAAGSYDVILTLIIVFHVIILISFKAFKLTKKCFANQKVKKQ